MSTEKAKPDTPYAVICPRHGQQFLTRPEYNAQISRADERWKCPVCFAVSEWDDDNEERYLGGQEESYG